MNTGGCSRSKQNIPVVWVMLRTSIALRVSHPESTYGLQKPCFCESHLFPLEKKTFVAPPLRRKHENVFAIFEIFFFSRFPVGEFLRFSFDVIKFVNGPCSHWQTVVDAIFQDRPVQKL